ncbi:hypothetical protein Y1Q_0010677 [Alligator mississippiensis]|uniref:Uncharacterized protein n=1 Tax=Alligator mississippiensis TaxID=8496 RepID=A0A151M6G3_ALLMI|nr:hypothetical protein Y1Q_0010677 [Alligator mississippiensis]
MGTKAGWLANQAVVSLQLGKAQKGEQKVVSCRKEEFMIRRIDDQPLQGGPKLEQTTDLTDPAAASSLVTALGFVNQAGFLPLQVSSSPELDNPEVSDGVSREAEVFFPRLLSDTSDCKD